MCTYDRTAGTTVGVKYHTPSQKKTFRRHFTNAEAFKTSLINSFHALTHILDDQNLTKFYTRQLFFKLG